MFFSSSNLSFLETNSKWCEKYVGRYYFNKMYNVACFLMKMIIEVFVTVKYKIHNYFHVNSFCYVTQNSVSNSVVVDSITLMTQLCTVFYNKRSNTFYLTNKLVFCKRQNVASKSECNLCCFWVSQENAHASCHPCVSWSCWLRRRIKKYKKS